jgi:hypothetical protein
VDNILKHLHILGLDYKLSETDYVVKEMEFSTRVKDFIVALRSCLMRRKNCSCAPDDIVGQCFWIVTTATSRFLRCRPKPSGQNDEGPDSGHAA